jgi:sulfite exporter TauE/SafE
MIALLAAVVAASLAGSLHCVGMCGPFVAFYAGGAETRRSRRVASHALYSAGRLVAYAVLGAVAGMLGATVELAGRLAGFQRAAAVVAGAVMITWGVAALLRARGVRLVGFHAPAAAAGLLRRAVARVADAPATARATTVGLLSGLLPCGWLWAFLVTAAGTADPASGIAVMAAFWLGTVPALVAVGVGAQLVGTRVRRAAPTVAALLIVALGVLALAIRPSPATAASKAIRGSADASVERVGSLDDDDAPCCEP